MKMTAVPNSLPAPIGGLNARDSLVAMPPTDAIVFKNWWPQPYGCSVRRGWRTIATLPAAVSSLGSWISTTGTKKLFGWANNIMYDIDLTGGGANVALSGALTNSVWQTISLNNTAGQTLICVNGADDAIYYTAGGYSTRSFTPGQWQGLDPRNCPQVTVHQSRLWAVEKNSNNGWYLPPDAIVGTFVRFDFGPLFPRGGTLEFLTTWTLDDGNGAEDHLVAISSNGDAVVYAGIDPSSDASWQLVGVYYVGSPVSGRRSFTKAGGDLLILTQQGVVSMSQLLTSTKVNQAENPLESRKIQFLISSLISANSSVEGWALDYFPPINMLMVNVPSNTVGGNVQLCANQLIGSWTQFSNLDTLAWETITNTVYFGSRSGTVGEFWFGNVDGANYDGSGGTEIFAEAQQAYSYLDRPSAQKQIGLYRPNFVVDIDVTFKSKIYYDFETSSLPTPDASAPALSTYWDAALWDTAVWVGGTRVQRYWIGAEGMGNAVSIAMLSRSKYGVLWVSTDFTTKTGMGVL